ncbi:lipoprotein [Spiroplasma apis]|uniref:Lipoprotein n=1 Tax=Spiroplasma apis B31 TaxID=1276258 RepID=V5RIR1_SPIAP|nr:lipoprotein [Spiroplasma apis]AHB36562.1 hypothetical protein SAPIS_v1c07170 [Spiroplasma apis B31]
MKKLLGLLGALGMVASTGVSVVACGKKTEESKTPEKEEAAKNEIKLDFVFKGVESIEYDGEEELADISKLILDALALTAGGDDSFYQTLMYEGDEQVYEFTLEDFEQNIKEIFEFEVAENKESVKISIKKADFFDNYLFIGEPITIALDNIGE